MTPGALWTSSDLVAMRFDDVVQEVNPFGPFQKRVCCLLCLLAIPGTIHIMATVFIMAVPHHRCAVPGLDNDTWESQGPEHDQVVSQVIPTDLTSNTWSRCLVRRYSHPDFPHLSNDTVECSRWVYSKETFEATLTSELNIVCTDTPFVAMANSVLMGGFLCGSLVLGTVADFIGRKKIVVICLVGQIGVTLATSFVYNFVVFVICRFFTTFFVIGSYLAAFVAGLELVGPQYRTVSGIAMGMFWTIGLFFTLLLAYFFRNWCHLQLAASCMNILCIPIMWFIPESPRWLVSRGRRQEASVIVRHAALVNKVVVSENVLSLQDLQNDGPQLNVCQLFAYPRLMLRCLIIFFNWGVISGVYYGLGLNVGSLSGDLHLNFLFAAMAELLADVFCLVLLGRTGRRLLHCVTMLLAGTACLAIIFPVLYGNQDTMWTATVLSMVGRFGISAAFSIIYVFTAELLPTSVRNSGMGVSSLNARFGGIASPYITSLVFYVGGNFGKALPSLIFGGLSILAGLASLWLPETYLQDLPETVEDANNFGRKTGRTTTEQGSLKV
ncbi:organic cation transporter protein-like isoform X1 [Pomacea canaliculata]|uniref:organic cation transporter protein-like isoform X1 n=1 Tax=Pomacea canaliculata TaxID=400727 RepID=UPI000D728708|nr:organic cation transporter protein-like isoform X1 [Pomacea canaliculata]